MRTPCHIVDREGSTEEYNIDLSSFGGNNMTAFIYLFISYQLLCPRTPQHQSNYITLSWRWSEESKKSEKVRACDEVLAGKRKEARDKGERREIFLVCPSFIFFSVFSLFPLSTSCYATSTHVCNALALMSTSLS